MLSRKILLVPAGAEKKHILFLLTAIIVTIVISFIIFINFASNPLKGKKIIIDPGHGGIDSGTTDEASFFEKDVNLQIAIKLKQLLEAEDCFVFLTRDCDISLDNWNNLSESRQKRDLIERVNMFNSGEHDIFISIHVNRSSNSQTVGPMVLCSTKLSQSKYLARYVQNSLNEHAKKIYKKEFRRNPVKSDFFILKNSTIPGILVETGFISNPVEKAKLQNEEYQLKLAKSIRTGIEKYFDKIDNLDPNSDEDSFSDEEDSIPFNITNEVRLVSK